MFFHTMAHLTTLHASIVSNYRLKFLTTAVSIMVLSGPDALDISKSDGNV